MYYQVEYTDRNGNKADDFLLEEDNIEEAKRYAEHRIDGSYGKTEWVSCKVKRISFSKALNLYNSNAVCWLKDCTPFEENY